MPVTTICALSDTHGTLSDRVLGVIASPSSGEVIQRLNKDGADAADLLGRPVDMILHAGDIGGYDHVKQSILDALARIAPVEVVLGNCDAAGYRLGGELLTRDVKALTVDGVRIALAHEPERLMHGAAFLLPPATLLVHGHTHVPRLARTRDEVVLCPGSPSRPRDPLMQKTLAFACIEDGALLDVMLVKV